MNNRIAAAAAALALAAPHGAWAKSDQNDLQLCRTTLVNETAAHHDNPVFRFKSAQGGAARKFTFEMKTESGRQTVVCKVKRGEIIDIAWSDANSADA